MVLGADIEMDLIRRGIEDSWWPRMRDQDLSIELINGAANLDPPSPLARRDLKFFLTCYEIINGRTTADFSQGERSNSLNRLRNVVDRQRKWDTFGPENKRDYCR
jgi:hypothetical protein